MTQLFAVFNSVVLMLYSLNNEAFQIHRGDYCYSMFKVKFSPKYIKDSHLANRNGQQIRPIK